MKTKKHGKKHINTSSKKPIYDNVEFDSGLEVYCYKQLQHNKIEFKYNDKTFTLVDAFEFITSSYEPDEKRGLLLSKKSNKLQSIKYTPDFVGDNWIIETKGRQSWTD